mmetsp:Transcript_25741/g.31116  ORF Transcript_25741/g.31116 Transcript_25741/m.31116 type:complete len:89 (-) Transcript_25741:250-516(-)
MIKSTPEDMALDGAMLYMCVMSSETTKDVFKGAVRINLKDVCTLAYSDNKTEKYEMPVTKYGQVRGYITCKIRSECRKNELFSRKTVG